MANRFPCALDASCSPLQGGLRQWRGEVLDISLTGVHLQLDRRFEPGAVLRLEVLDEQLAVIATWLVQARWVRQVSGRLKSDYRYSAKLVYNNYPWPDALSDTQKANALYRWFLPLLRMDTVPKFVQLIKLVQQEVGMGNERVRAPRLVLAGSERETAVETIKAVLRARPDL